MNNTNSNFERNLVVFWEHAFSKFGFGDGEFCLTYAVADTLEREGYEVVYRPWGIHNETISSIKLDGVEFMPIGNAEFCVGYSDPRDYLPVEIISCLDKYFYGC